MYIYIHSNHHFLHHITFIVCLRHFCHRLPLLRPDRHHRANGATYNLQATEKDATRRTLWERQLGWVKSPPKGSP